MSDEIYEYLLYDGVKHVSPASFSKEAAAATITVAGFSKTFSMTGWRLGTLVANPQVAKAVASLQSKTSSNATTFAQYGALAAMQNWEVETAISGMLKFLTAVACDFWKACEQSMASNASELKERSIYFRKWKRSA